MSSFVGMNPAAASAKADALFAQIGTINHLITELGQTQHAVQNPHAYGIDPGEKTIAPFSISSVAGAKADLSAATASIADLVQRVRTEVGAQNIASGNQYNFSTAIGPVSAKKPQQNGGDPIGGIITVVQTFRKYRTLLVSGPRAMLQAPAAVAFLAKWPLFWGSAVEPSGYFNRMEYDFGSEFLKSYTASGNRFINSLYNKANFLKADYIWSSTAGKIADLAPVAKVLPGLADSIAKSAAFLKSASLWGGKALGVVGIGFSAYSLVSGIVGVSSGHGTSEDAWAIADGAVGLICGIGSLAPPPVGVVFAAVGGAYALGRWLFGADSSGKTGIDHIADGVNAAGKWTGEAATNVGNFVAGANKAVANGIVNGAQVVGNTVNHAVDDAKKVIGNLWPWH